ncbi:regulatory protein TetR [Mycolicibacterium rhodesiae JS60]|nr:regulatory protein TetR [Mycolicibacterium rhodesiae JS60]
MSGRGGGATKPGITRSKERKRDEIVAAATECFSRYGVERSRIEDVATAAGISGTNFYHFFPSRSALIDAVVLSRVEAIVTTVAPTIDGAPSFEAALVSGVVTTVETCRSDRIFMELLRLTRQKRLGELGGQPYAFGYDMLERLWRPALERARQARELREDLVDDQDTIVWLGRVLVMLLLNDELTSEKIGRTVAMYVAPALTAVR